MPIRVSCACGRTLSAPDVYAGGQGECRYCGRTVEIPAITPDVVSTGERQADVSDPPTVLGEEVAPPSPADKPRSSDLKSAPAPVAARQTGSDASFPPIPPAALRRQFRARPEEMTTFLTPPSVALSPATQPFSWDRFFGAVLSSRSINWLLILGGGLAIVGVVAFLVSLGLFAYPVFMATALAVGALALVVGGWFIATTSPAKEAGTALAFLGCAVLPLNLWYVSYQNLVPDSSLWIGALLMMAVSVASVMILRSPLFLYTAVAKAVLTVFLAIWPLGLLDATGVCVTFVVLGAIAIAGEHVFPRHSDTFRRHRFGMPLFWSGHVLLAAGLVTLVLVQLAGLIFRPDPETGTLTIFGFYEWPGTAILRSSALAGALWFLGGVAYLWSDFAVRRLGIFTMIGVLCLVCAELTVLDYFRYQGEVAIIALSLTALIGNLLASRFYNRSHFAANLAPPMGLALAIVPLIIGLVLYVRAIVPITGDAAEAPVTEGATWTISLTWLYVIAMAIAAAVHRLSAYLYKDKTYGTSALYFFGSLAALVLAFAGVLHLLDVIPRYQIVILMLFPIAYFGAAYAWRGKSPEYPLYAAGHTLTVVLGLAGLTILIVRLLARDGVGVVPTDHLGMAVVFGQASIAYALAGLTRRREINAALLAISLSLSVWQLLWYFGVLDAVYPVTYGAIGLALLFVGRRLGIEKKVLYDGRGLPIVRSRGAGVALLQGGHGVLLIAFAAAAYLAIRHMIVSADADEEQYRWLRFVSLVLTVVIAGAATLVSRGHVMQRVHILAAVILAVLAAVLLHRLVDINALRLAEIAAVLIGCFLITVAFLGRMREVNPGDDELVTLGLWIGSVLVVLPLVTAVIVQRILADENGFGSLTIDGLVLVTLSVGLLVLGIAFRIKSTTILGAIGLVFYLAILLLTMPIWSLQYVSVYLVILGVLVFGLGFLALLYREWITRIPSQIAERRGPFRLLTWR